MPQISSVGNPEISDAAVAKDGRVFVADTLLDPNKRQSNPKYVESVELKSPPGFRRLKTVLENLKIPHEYLDEGNFESNVSGILQKITKGADKPA
ncbi:MAG: hypothetical protein OXU31_01460 [Gammaproteobacteria bacterium]|nr:hypothetical protein [Gammaproteobacteria bacterium]